MIVQVLTTLGVAGSALPGLASTAAGVPWQAAVVLSVLGLAAATALAWRMETHRQERYRMWFTLAKKKAKGGQALDLNDALEDVAAAQRQDPGSSSPPAPRRTRITRKTAQP